MKTLSKTALVGALVSFASDAREQIVPRIFSLAEIEEEARKVVRAFEASIHANIWNQIDTLIQRSNLSLSLLAETAEKHLRGESLKEILQGISPETPCEEELLPKLWRRLSQLVHDSNSRPKNSKTDATAAVF